MIIICHRHSKANIIVENHVAILADYGLPSCLQEDRNMFVRKIVKAPELFEPRNNQFVEPTPGSDIYDMATSFYEILTEQLPFGGDYMTPKSKLVTEVDPSGARPQYPSFLESLLEQGRCVSAAKGLTTPSSVWNMIGKCWSPDITARPSARDVSTHIGQFNLL